VDVTSFSNRASFEGSPVHDVRDVILKPGRNLWRSARADRLAFLIDGEEYFLRLAEVLPQARRSIFIVGWDFNPNIRLQPRDPESPLLGDLLRSIVEANPELELRILVWGMGPIYSGKSFKMFGKMPWSDHPRIHLRFDFRHPLRGSHHQKIVVIDDQTAFVGGIDLTARRWDDRSHTIDNPVRVSPDGTPYGPVHDMQTLVTGGIASLIGGVFRRRWQKATKETVPAITVDTPAPWPEGLKPTLVDCNAGIALTEPWKWKGLRGHREAIKLTQDALKSARQHLYIETQYFASFSVGRTLARQLRSATGPEIVVIVTCESHGFLERLTMGGNRNRLIRRLQRADRYGRLRIFFAVTPDGKGGEREIIVHSKLIIVDDRFVRVGSSNLNNRSEGLDTECDIAVESSDPVARASITALRDELLAEHLDTSPAEVARLVQETGSLIAAVDQLNTRPRGLRPFDIDPNKGETGSLIGTGLVDPKQPFWPIPEINAWVRKTVSRLSSRRLS
jgi:phosphatidylserine/phosphatidylglycerophosphate/cardiolipin synthase-like enzyme